VERPKKLLLQLAGICLQLSMVLLDLLKLKNIFSRNVHSFIIELLPLLSIKNISCCNSGIVLFQQCAIQKCVNKLNNNKSADQLLYFTPKPVTILSLQFNAMLVLYPTYIPKNMLSILCTAVAIMEFNYVGQYVR
jgi:hypothetical protein